MFIAFTPDTTLQYTVGELVTGSATGARGIITSYKQGVVRDILVDDVGDGYTGPPGITPQHRAVQVHKQQRHV